MMKLCPFCGGRADVKVFMPGKVTVRCLTLTCPARSTRCYTTHKKAWRFWNERFDQSEAMDADDEGPGETVGDVG